MQTDIPNDVYSNLMQIVVLGIATVVPAAMKRRCIDNDRRCRKQWRMDVIRQIVLTISAMATLMAIAIVYNGDDVLNLVTLVSVDLMLGSCIDAIMLTLLRNSGARIGHYGRPMDYAVAVWHTVASMTLCITARCTSAITAICIFPFVNSHIEAGQSAVDTQFIIIGLPSLYAASRMVLLDQFFRQSDGYDAMRCTGTTVESPFAITEDDESPEVHPDPADPPDSAEQGTP